MITHRGKLGGRKGRRERRGRVEEWEEGKRERRGRERGGEEREEGKGRRKERKEEGREEKRGRECRGGKGRERVNSCIHYLVVTLPHTLSNSSVIRGRIMPIPVITISTN